MKNTLIFLGIVLVIKFIVKELSKPGKPKDLLEDDHKIEEGYPTSTMRSLHINSTKEHQLVNNGYTNEQLDKYDGIEDEQSIYTKNMFIESHYELNLSLFERDLTVDMVNDAYEMLLDKHMDNIKKGIPEVFNINEKKEARDYLLSKLGGNPRT
jgi:hypothetical protein